MNTYIISSYDGTSFYLDDYLKIKFVPIKNLLDKKIHVELQESGKILQIIIDFYNIARFEFEEDNENINKFIQRFDIKILEDLLFSANRFKMEYLKSFCLRYIEIEKNLLNTNEIN